MDNNKNLNKRINIRINNNLYNSLEEASNKNAVTKSEYIRNTLIDTLYREGFIDENNQLIDKDLIKEG